MEGAKTERVPIMFDPQLVKLVDDFGFENRIRTRAEVVRTLVRKGLEAAKETKKGEALA